LEPSGNIGEKGAFNLFYVSSNGKNVFGKSRILNAENVMEGK